MSPKKDDTMKKEKKSLFQIGTKIKARRKALGLTQEKLAEMINCSFKTIGNIENDNTIPDTRQIINLCDVLDMTFDELFRDVLKKRDENFVTPDDFSLPDAEDARGKFLPQGRHVEGEAFPYLLNRVIVKPTRPTACVQMQEYITTRLETLSENDLKTLKTVLDCLITNK